MWLLCHWSKYVTSLLLKYRLSVWIEEKSQFMVNAKRPHAWWIQNDVISGHNQTPAVVEINKLNPKVDSVKSAPATEAKLMELLAYFNLYCNAKNYIDEEPWWPCLTTENSIIKLGPAPGRKRKTCYALRAQFLKNVDSERIWQRFPSRSEMNAATMHFLAQ